MLMCMMGSLSLTSHAEELTIKVNKKYLNLPVSHKVDRAEMTMKIGNITTRNFQIRLAPDNPDYWVFCDMSAFKGQKVQISYKGNEQGLKQIYQADSFAGEDSLYKELNRPQIHFTSRRGWNNDPNGLVLTMELFNTSIL